MPFIDRDSGEVRAVGDSLLHDGKVLTIQYIEPPHKEGASGYITTENGRYYASVYNLRWRDVEEDTEEEEELSMREVDEAWNRLLAPLVEKSPRHESFIKIAMALRPTLGQLPMKSRVSIMLHLSHLAGKDIAKECFPPLNAWLDYCSDTNILKRRQAREKASEEITEAAVARMQGKKS